MKKFLLVAALAACSVWAVGAQAVTTTGFPDNGLHPEVGAIMVPARSGVGYAEVCSGTLVSPTIFLTASHCTSFLEADPRPDYVTFDETDVEHEVSCALGEPLWHVAWQDVRPIGGEGSDAVIERAYQRFLAVYQAVVEQSAGKQSLQDARRTTADE